MFATFSRFLRFNFYNVTVRVFNATVWVIMHLTQSETIILEIIWVVSYGGGAHVSEFTLVLLRTLTPLS